MPFCNVYETVLVGPCLPKYVGRVVLIVLNAISTTGRIDSIATTSSIVLAILGSIGNTVVVGLHILEV